MTRVVSSQASRDATRVLKRLTREPKGGGLIDLHLVCAELACLGPERAAAALAHLKQRWKRRNGDFTKLRDTARYGLLDFAVMPSKRFPVWSASPVPGNPQVDDAQLSALIPVLLEAGADINGEEGAAPLFSCFQLDRLQQLIAAGADVNRKDTIGWTCLYYAAARGDEPAVRALLTAGAIVSDALLAAVDNPPIAELLRTAHHAQRLAQECASGTARQGTTRL